ncbi:methyltransferase FkbM [Paramagnetospirillum marisnigri]|uniref:Methyltransferase FkbM n=1 Tax=Paramagnetospirillum marisnigri TaxID=1285242 RepID=A0A178MVK8_9PROT|nr:FkbM family methyltransferase [Paramagnetospirillum marisnigri]OAN54577.1 methyltransferase FkbM [Paramagnetospirillum marisnigri]
MTKHVSFSEITKTNLRIKLVDIGANPILGKPPYAPLMDVGEADVIGFEPNPEALAKLNEMKGPNETYLPHAIGDGTRRALHICQDGGMTSLLEPDPKVLDLFHGFPDWGAVIATEEIDTVRLDDIPQARGVDYIKIDIQGGELMALASGPDCLASTLLIQCEVEFMPMYRDQPLFSEVEQFLRGHGFMFHRFFPAVSRVIRPMKVKNDIRAGLSQLVWADAIFIRDITKLDRLSDIQLLKLAKILHECYQSIDVILYLLLEYDRRCSTAIADAYKRFLMTLG